MHLKTFGPPALFAFMLGVLLEAPVCIPRALWPSSLYEFLCLLLSLAEIALLTNLVLSPLTIWRRPRPAVGAVMLVSSYAFGLSVWLFSAVLAYAQWGVFGLVLGFMLLGVGVVPLALLAAILLGRWSMFASIVIGLVLAFGTRLVAIMWLQSTD